MKAVRLLASWSRARWFSSFLDQRVRIPRLRLTGFDDPAPCAPAGRARLSLISSPRARMCGVYPCWTARLCVGGES